MKYSIQQQQNILYLSTHRTFSRIVHMIGHKISLSKIKKIEIIPSIFSHHNDIKLNINKQENWETNKQSYSYSWKTNGSKKKTDINNILKQLKMEIQHTNTYKTSQRQF